MSNYITGITNAYYPDHESAEAGISSLNDEVYARENPDKTWTVYQMTTQPLLPNGYTVPPKLAMLFASVAPMMVLESEKPHPIAENITREKAAALVMNHEENPVPFAGLPILRQIMRPEDSSTYWRRCIQPT